MDFEKFLLGKISRKIILGFLIVALALGVMGGFSDYYMQKISKPLEKDLPDAVTHLELESNLEALADIIQYYDEVLTMSARNYAFTSDTKWKTRYNEIVPKLDNAIKEAIEKGDEKDKEFFSSVDSANIALVEMEENAIALVDNGNLEEAVEILESTEYWEQKEIYKQGLVNYVERRGKEYDEAVITSTETLNHILSENKTTINFSRTLNLTFIIAIFIFALSFGLFISRRISKPVEELSKASEELKKKNFKTRVNIKTGDELEQLGESFNKTAEALENMDKEHKQLEKAKTEFLSITS